MKADAAQINLVLAWLWILLGFISGMVLGMFFHRENWLGGYASFKRRMYRLAHISFFGLGAVNLLFWLTTKSLSVSSPILTAASWLFVAGAITMPICCVIMAHWPKRHLIFSVPVVSLLLGGGVMCAAVGRPEISKAVFQVGRVSPHPDPLPRGEGTAGHHLVFFNNRPANSVAGFFVELDAIPPHPPAATVRKHGEAGGRWGRGEQFDSPLFSPTSNQSIPTNLNLFQP